MPEAYLCWKHIYIYDTINLQIVQVEPAFANASGRSSAASGRAAPDYSCLVGGKNVARHTIQELQSMITVWMGDCKTARGEKKLITRDLGSCVGIAVRDPETGVGGLLHIMLPAYVPDGSGMSFNPAKYADTGIDEMIRMLVQAGAARERLVAKLAGGAHMTRSPDVPEWNDISSRNLKAVRKKLGELQIPVLAEAVGAHHPRTVIFEPASGMLTIITAGRPDRVI